MKSFAERDKLVTSHYVAGKKLIDIARLFGFSSPGYVRQIARRNGAKPRKNGRPKDAAD